MGLRPKLKDVPKREKHKFPTPRDMIEYMQKQPIPLSYTLGILHKLSRDLPGAEIVRSDGDVYVSLVHENCEIIVAHATDQDGMTTILVERFGHDCSLRILAGIAINNDTTYQSVCGTVKKAIARAARM